MKTLVSRFVLNAAFLASAGNASFAMADENWPQWRGPNRDGHAAPQALLKSWPVQGPKLAWSFGETGAGYSSVTVADGQIFTLGKINNANEETTASVTSNSTNVSPYFFAIFIVTLRLHPDW